MITGITTPTSFMHGYSAIPLRVLDTDATQLPGYKYLFNLLSDSILVTTTSTFVLGPDSLLTLNFATNHNFKLGASLFIENSTDIYTGYYIVMAVPSATSIRINLVLQTPITGTLTVYSALKYKMNPGPDGDARIDFSNTLKDYVTSDLQDVNEIFDAPNTRHSIRINTGFESNSFLTFYDNYFSGGNVGFISTETLASTTLKIGDVINVQQNLYEATYVDSVGYINSNGELKLALELAPGTDATLWSVGTTILINGQVTYPSNNGYTTVSDSFSVILQTNMDTTIPEGVYTGEGGKVLSVITPKYNATCIIKDLIEVGGELVVVTDLLWDKSTPAIGGTITSSSLVKSSIWNGPTYDVDIFNSYINQNDYSLTAMNDFVIFNTTSVGGPSTMLSRIERTKIEKETKSWLLFHNTTTPLCDGVRFWFYDSNDNALGVTYVINTTSNLDDFYCPIGINQLLECVNKSETVPLSSYFNNISYYKVQAIKNAVVGTKTPLGKELQFEVSNDCSRYDMLHLMWKDAKGSWISFSFKYIHTNSTEVSRTSYYKNSWNWDNSSFGYDSYSKGDSSFFVRGRDKMSLNSGWVNEYDNTIIKDLLMSSSVYLQDSDGTLKACTILNNELTFGSKQNDDVWQYKIDIKMANDEFRY